MVIIPRMVFYAAQLGIHRETIEQVVIGSLEAIHALMPVDKVSIIVTAHGRGVIRELCIGGSANSLTDVRISIDPNSPFVATSIQFEPFPLLAHELHHTMRHRTVGYGSVLFRAMISEGLADHFAMEVAGVAPPIWSIAVQGDELETWLARASGEWLRASYNHDVWFFGAGPEIPRWAGYSLGFELVRRYLATNPDRKPSELFGESAASFLPAEASN